MFVTLSNMKSAEFPIKTLYWLQAQFIVCCFLNILKYAQ